MPVLAISQSKWDSVQVKSTQLAPELHRIFVGEGVSMLAFQSESGMLLVDAAYEQTGNKVMAQLKKIGDADIEYIINTHYHGDHTGGNKPLGKDAVIISHNYVKEILSKDRGKGERKQKAFPSYAQPNITFNDSLTLYFNNYPVRLTHLCGGHTAGDILVYFPEQKVLATGDLVFADKFPYVDLQHGGNALRYLEQVKKITKRFPDDLIIVGGHGPVYSMKDLQNYYLTLTETVRVIRQAKEEGQTVKQMKENRILSDWEKFGTGFISEDFWIETVYHSL